MIKDNKNKDAGIEDKNLANKITQLLNENTKLSTELNNLNYILDTFPLFICVLEESLQITYTNNAYKNYLNLFGVDENDIIGKSFLDFLTTEKRDEEFSLFKKTTLEKPLIPKNYTLEHSIIDKNNETHFQKWTHYPIFNEEKQTYEFFSVGEDITLRKQKEKELIYTKNKLDLVLSNIPQLIFLVQKKGDFVYFTDTFSPEEKLLIPKSLFLNRKVSEVFPEPISTPLEEAIEAMASSDINSSTYEYNLKVLGFDNYFQANVKEIRDKEYIVSVTDITQHKKTQEQLIYVSTHDFLTGLYNRLYFENKLREIDAPNNLPISIIFADVDGLKHVNDTQGHKVGDELIVLIANILKDSFRYEDIISRWGGDEFAILLPKTAYETAQNRAYIADENCKKSKNNFLVSMSVGISTKSSPEISIDSMLIEAENTMYQLKNSKGIKQR